MLSRRLFFGAASAAAAAVGRAAKNASGRPALLGGAPVRTKPFPEWPVIDSADERAWTRVLRSKAWFRRDGERVEEFERAWAKTIGARHVVATNGGTTALFAALHALDIGPKDEVLVPPYTFIATINAVLLHHALPIFVDTDRETSQIDARKIDDAVTSRTRAILPVHLGGSAADMDRVLKVAAKRKLPVIEDACQSHLAEWRGKKVGTLGTMGCFSFQASKNLNCGEGGALATDDDRLAARASSFHNNSSSLHGEPDRRLLGCNLRMTEFQGALLGSQLTRLEEQARRREKNARRLNDLLKAIDGLSPADTYSGCTRNAYHLYMFRYDTEAFAGLPKKRLIEALRAEGVPVSGGYGPLNRDRFLKETFASRPFRAIYSKKEIDDWAERCRCPENDALCDEALWLPQTLLLGEKSDMEDVAAAMEKVQRHAEELAAAA